jgi:hypothetical protein
VGIGQEPGAVVISIGMSQQPESSSTSLPTTVSVRPASLAEPAADPAHGIVSPSMDPNNQHRVPRWLQRMDLFLRVMIRMYIGLALCYAPWWPAFWDQNPIVAHFPAVAAIAANGAVRGVVSGLGLLNLWIALQDAIHFKRTDVRAYEVKDR